MKTVVLTPGRTFAENARRKFRQSGIEFKQRYLFDAIPVFDSPEIILVGPFLGATSAAMVLQALLPARMALLIGSCGLVEKTGETPIGSIVVPTHHARVSNANQLEALEPESLSSGAIEQQFRESLSVRLPLHLLPVVTVERPVTTVTLFPPSALAVEMEYAGARDAAGQVEVLAAFIVSDRVCSAGHTTAFSKVKRSEECEILLESTVRFVLDAHISER